MENTNKPLLNDPAIYPDSQVLKQYLKDSFPVYQELEKYLVNENNNFLPEWRFYKDGNSWLCKVTFKKKTLFWLSIWDGYFKAGFYFTEKHKTEIKALPISELIKEQFFSSNPIGKLLPMSFTLTSSDQLTDLKTVIEFKSKLK